MPHSCDSRGAFGLAVGRACNLFMPAPVMLPELKTALELRGVEGSRPELSGVRPVGSLELGVLPLLLTR